MANKPDVTFVCCVESGALEIQTIRMVESFRRWGGRFADAPICAVTPRLGSPLRQETHQAFAKLNVEYLCFRADNPYAWKGFLNRHYSMAAVEKQSKSEFIGWLDSDLIIVDEPDKLILEAGEDFVACPSDRNMGVAEPTDDFYQYWEKVCRIVGIKIEDLPWVVTERDQQRIRFYINGGVFVYRRSTGLAQAQLDTILRVFNSRIAPRASKRVFFTQHVIGMGVVQMGLSWRALPHSHNYGISSKTYDKWYDPEKMRAAKIIHYHDGMWSWFWPRLLKCLEDTHPEVAAWLEPKGPLDYQKPPVQWRLTNKLLEQMRSRQEKTYLQSCQRV